jgi:predicted RNA binding protein YcfA (HicA-like mRNA interferase family)
VATGGRKFRNLKADQAVRAFERLGYTLVRVRGSHHFFKHPDKGPLVLPIHHGRIKVGIIMDALKKAAISVDEFEERL